MSDCWRQKERLQKGTRKFVKIMVVSNLLIMVIAFLRVCVHVSRLVKNVRCWHLFSLWYRNGLLQINHVSLKQFLCFHGTGDGTQGCLRARQAFYYCATFPTQINKAVFKNNLCTLWYSQHHSFGVILCFSESRPSLTGCIHDSYVLQWWSQMPVMAHIGGGRGLLLY